MTTGNHAGECAIYMARQTDLPYVSVVMIIALIKSQADGGTVFHLLCPLTLQGCLEIEALCVACWSGTGNLIASSLTRGAMDK